MFYRLGNKILSLTEVSENTSTNIPTPFYRWKVNIKNINDYYIGGENCPISDGGFSITSNGGMGNASLKFLFFDVPVYFKDKIMIYYNGSKKYSGYVKDEPDPEGDKVSVIPYSNRFEKALYNYDYSSTTVTINNIIEDVITNKSSQLELSYNNSFIDTGTTETLNPKYDYENVKTIFEGLIKQIDNREIGINENDIPYIKAYSTVVDYIIYNDDNCNFVSLEYKSDNSKIKNTRQQIYQKTTSNDNIRLGQIGYSTSGDFPVLSIENKIGIKEGKATAPDGLNSTNALDYMYKKLTIDTQTIDNIKVKGYDIRQNDLNCFDLIKIQKQESLIWHTISDCESLTNFSTGVLNSDSKIGSYSITFSNALSYDPQETLKYKKLQKIGFYIKSDKQGINVNVNTHHVISGWNSGPWNSDYWNISESSNVSIGNIYIKSLNEWQWFDMVVLSDKIRVINIQTDSTATIYIDEIKALCYYRKFYQGNIIQIDYSLKSDLINFEMGTYEESLDDEFFKLQKEVEALQNTITES